MSETKLNATRKSITHKAVIRCSPELCEKCGAPVGESRFKFFFTVGIVEGRPVELFMHMDQCGSAIDGFAKCWALAISLCLRNGVPLAKLVEKFRFQRFEPQGMTEDAGAPIVMSVVDYVIGWMCRYFEDNKQKDCDAKM